MISAAVVFVLSDLFFVNMWTSMPRNTMLIVMCPLGKENPVSWIIWLVGLAIWKISFDAFMASAVIVIITANIMPCFFCDLKNR